MCKRKHVTNMRAAGSDEALRPHTPAQVQPGGGTGVLNDDDMLEVTPKNYRIRKVILSGSERLKLQSKGKQ